MTAYQIEGLILAACATAGIALEYLSAIEVATVTGGEAITGADRISKGINSASTAEASLAERIIEAERTGSGLKSDAIHRAASFLTKEQLEAGSTFTIKGGDGVVRELLQTRGGLNGKNGIFEYLLDPTKGVTHQRFISGGKITGTPNQ